MRIRVATGDDAEAITCLYAPLVLDTVISFEFVPPTVEEMRGRTLSTLETLPWLVSLDESGAVSGYVYASKHRERPAYRWAVDTTAYVRRDRHRQGIGKALYERLFADLARLGYFQAFAGIALPNVASVALHEAVGFEHIGVYRDVGFKLGAWHDVGWWQRRLQSQSAPLEPLKFGAT